jgi:Tfp pilus assembly protein FimT
MIVLVLIGIASAMIIPAMHGTYEDALLRSTARKLVDVFNLANSRAVTLNQPFRVRLDTKEGKYSLEPIKIPTAQTTPTRQLSRMEGTLDKRVSIELQQPEAEAEQSEPTDQTTSTDRDTISFYPDGTADSRQLLLRDRQGFQLALRINPITARVHILEQPPK